MNRVFWASLENEDVEVLKRNLELEEIFFGLRDGDVESDVKSFDAVFGIKRGMEFSVYLYRGAYWGCVDDVSAEEYVKGGVPLTPVYEIIEEGLTGLANVTKVAYSENIIIDVENAKKLAEIALEVV